MLTYKGCSSPGYLHELSLQQETLELGTLYSNISGSEFWSSNKAVENIQHGKFYCDACDKVFFTLKKFEKHNATHVKCEFEGCSYVGNEENVELHVEIQHFTGLAHKIMGVQTDEDILKWREERKNKFPTRKKIIMLLAEKEEKLERGEVLDKKPAKFRRRPRRQAREFKTQGFGRPVMCRINCVDSSEEDEELTCIKQFNGSGIIRDRYPELNLEAQNVEEEVMRLSGDNITDDEDVQGACGEGLRMVLGGLGALMGAYNSDSSDLEEGEIKDDDDRPYETSRTIENSKKLHNPFADPSPGCLPSQDSLKVPYAGKRPWTRNKRNSDKKHRKREPVVTKKCQEETENLQITGVVPTDPHMADSPFANVKLKAPRKTLLTTLLHSEIQRERNMVLQCVRHIVRKHFFQIYDNQS